MSPLSVRLFPLLKLSLPFLATPRLHFSSFFATPDLRLSCFIATPHLTHTYFHLTHSHTSYDPIMPTYPTPVRIWKTHLSYKNSSLLYLPRIQKYLQDFSIPYNIRIAIIDILIKSKETQRHMVISKLEGYMSQLKSTTRPPLPEEINAKRQKLSHPTVCQHPSYSAIVLPSIDTNTFDTTLRASTDFRQASLSTILEEIYSSFRQPRSYHPQGNNPDRVLSEIIHLFSAGRIHEAACKLQFFSQHDAFHIIAQGINSLLFIRHHNTASTTDSSKLALDCLFALGIPSHTYPEPALYPALHPSLPVPSLPCPDSQMQYMWTPAHYQPGNYPWFGSHNSFTSMHVKDNDADHIFQNSQMFGSLVVWRHTTSGRESVTMSYFRVVMHSAHYCVMILWLRLLCHNYVQKSLLIGPTSYVRYSMPATRLGKATLSLLLLAITTISHSFASSFESRNMRARAFQLRYATLSSITNPVASLALIYKGSTPWTSKR